MANYPKSIMDSLREYSEKYKLDSQGYKDLINRVEKIPLSSLEKLEIYNKGKTNLERGSLIVVKAPTTKGNIARVYVALTGMPIISGEGGKVPVLDLHSLNIFEDPPIDCIKPIPTSDNQKKNDTNTQGFYVLSNLGVRDMEQRKKEEEAPLEIYNTPKKESKKKTTKKKETKKDTEMKSTEKKEKREKILQTVKEVAKEEKKDGVTGIRKVGRKIEEDKKKEKEEKEIRQLEDIYKKMRFACVTTIRSMGYTKTDAEGICTDLDGVIEEHVRGAISKKTPNAVEEYIRLLTDKVIPSKVKKPKVKRVASKPDLTEEESKIDSKITRSNLESLLMTACFWLSSRYTSTTEESYMMCEERKEFISDIASEMMDGKIDLIKAMRQLEITFIEGEKHPIVQKVKVSQRELLKTQVNSIMTELISKKLGITTLVKEESSVIHNIDNGLCIFYKEEADDEVHRIVAKSLRTTESRLYNPHKKSREVGYDYERCFDLVFDYKNKAYAAAGGRIMPSRLIAELEGSISDENIKIMISDVPIL